MACVLCQESVRTDFCSNCRSALQRCRLGCSVELAPLGRPLSLYALFHYRDEARALLHEAKIACAWRALIAIERCFFLDAEVQAVFSWADAVIAAPSSLWGRLRGRHDVAGYVGESLARAFGKPFHQPRGPRSWRWRKRAFANRRERQVQFRFRAETEDAHQELSAENILLVDDVVTTGLTMAELSEHFSGKHLRLVAFAHA